MVRRIACVFVSFAVLAGACSGGDDTPDAGSSGSSSDESTSASASESAGSEDPEAADASEPDQEPEPESDTAEEAEDVAEPEPEPEEPAGPRLVETPLGTFEVPADPERIVITDTNAALSLAFDLGVEVYGTWDAAGLGTPARTLLSQEEWDSLELVGSGITPNVELLAAAEPDLVIHPPITDDDIDLISPFSAIVPTESTLAWRDDARVVADALNRVDELDALIADYDERAEALAARIDEEIGDPSIAVLRVRPDSQRVHTNLHFSGELLTDMGLRVPDDYVFEPGPSRNESTLLVNLSSEQVGLLTDVDYIFVMPVGTFLQTEEEVQASLDTLQSGALWQTLPAVQEGRVTVVGAHWFFGSLRAANLALDDVEEFFFG